MKWMLVLACLAMGTTAMGSSEKSDTSARNVQIVKAWAQALERGDRIGAEQFLSEDTRNFGRTVGREGYRRVWDDIYTTFPDWKMEIVDLVATGDSVILRAQVSATHRGVGRLPINGGLLVGVQPTGRHFEVQHIHWFKLRDGRITDHYATRDDIGMMQQLGLLPDVSRPDVKPRVEVQAR